MEVEVGRFVFLFHDLVRCILKVVWNEVSKARYKKRFVCWFDVLDV